MGEQKEKNVWILLIIFHNIWDTGISPVDDLSKVHC
jgi:hypothetical protein